MHHQLLRRPKAQRNLRSGEYLSSRITPCATTPASSHCAIWSISGFGNLRMILSMDIGLMLNAMCNAVGPLAGYARWVDVTPVLVCTLTLRPSRILIISAYPPIVARWREDPVQGFPSKGPQGVSRSEFMSPWKRAHLHFVKSSLLQYRCAS
ncbi:hypothetical protein P170DRAFT_8253 [Aspergillus steynii IBT 23096]|uniref:Uncharacterized protein n=1 Tax=Aspergillus steynii IBT 23096 TaxID=1392250 RepID=A0A2I2GMK5_9EURO|nr:uncharacterized protein P170DRAFT_8253 [Aspergillus steynii IBT 23096]PLB54094.1 hypothetical protein P170DRAFT_8253 [Aspergillus steynii IBT 23096]